MKIKLDKTKLGAVVNAHSEKRATSGTVVIVDDEPSNLYSLQRTLEDHFEILAFSDPREALTAIRDKVVDVIISDQRMPEMLGTEFLSETMKSNHDNVRMILTGYTDAKDLVTCINDGLIYRYLVKPWSSEEIIAVTRQGVEKAYQDRIFRRLVPNQVVKRLYPDGMQDAQPGQGREIACACMFLDMRRFTALADTMTADETFRFLTSFLGEIGPEINAHNGFIDKYLGDGVMAVFDREGHYAEDAVRCAIHLNDVISKYNDLHRSESLPSNRAGGELRSPVKVGIGIHYGPVMLGMVGFADRLDFTILGDVVNTAARLQELTKRFGADIIVHDEIASRLPPNDYRRRRLGNVQVRGKKESVAIWEVFESNEPLLRDRKVATTQEFEAAVSSQAVGDIDKARQIFEALAKSEHKDLAVTCYLENLESRFLADYSRDDDI